MRRSSLLLAFSVWSCDSPGDKPSPEPSPSVHSAAARASASTPAAAAAPPPSGSAGAVTARAYDAKQLRVMPCAKIEPPNTVTAIGCKVGFVFYGPYASAPVGADVELSFTVEAVSTFSVYVEIVSNMGTQPYASLPEQTIEKGQTRKLGLKMRTYVPIEGMETRLIVSSGEPASFKVHGYALNVR